MTFVDMHVKWSVTLKDRLGPEILTVLETKGQFLHRLLLHVKVPDWLSNLNAFLTKKLPKFLSRLNEMSRGRENMCLVSGSSRRILKFLRMTDTIQELITKQELPVTAQNLIINTPRTSCIYFKPNIHKANNPGRPIVSACSCPTER